jgi:hypothetical protein
LRLRLKASSGRRRHYDRFPYRRSHVTAPVDYGQLLTHPTTTRQAAALCPAATGDEGCCSWRCLGVWHMEYGQLPTWSRLHLYMYIWPNNNDRITTYHRMSRTEVDAKWFSWGPTTVCLDLTLRGPVLATVSAPVLPRDGHVLSWTLTASH